MYQHRRAGVAHARRALPLRLEIEVGIVYADFFFVEALLRQRGLFAE